MTVSKGAWKRIPVTEETWQEMSRLREPGQTYDILIRAMVEREKKQRLAADMKRIEEEGDFVPFDA
jgi:uncharacterized ferredoxin-like protein